MEVTLISQGVDLMLFGMGTVFAFLTLLVGITHLMSMTVNKMAPEESDTLVGVLALNSAPIVIEPNVAKVIQAAIDQHRSR
jgi:oxaloacetate decarboxylase (Na+ extruding) subunit gamma